MRATSFLAMAVVLAASAVAAEPSGTESQAARASSRRRGRVVAPQMRELATSSVTERASAPWARDLSAIEVENRNTGAHDAIRLYRDDGSVDERSMRAFERVAASRDGLPEGKEPLDRRLVKLVVRAAYHFGGKTISIVSATRRRSRGRHRHGEALDFALTGVRASKLASYLRRTPRAGVGIYTNPRTQYVHLDVRARSYHWADASPPGVTWRERRLRDPKQVARDASYTPAMDLPEPAVQSVASLP